MVVYTVAPALAAGDIERLVSFPIEQSVATVPGREQVRSFFRFGHSDVTIAAGHSQRRAHSAHGFY